MAPAQGIYPLYTSRRRNTLYIPKLTYKPQYLTSTGTRDFVARGWHALCASHIRVGFSVANVKAVEAQIHKHKEQVNTDFKKDGEDFERLLGSLTLTKSAGYTIEKVEAGLDSFPDFIPYARDRIVDFEKEQKTTILKYNEDINSLLHATLLVKAHLIAILYVESQIFLCQCSRCSDPMAPTPNTIDEEIKRAIHSLYVLQSSTHGYLGTETQTALTTEVKAFATSLGNIAELARNQGINVNRPNYDPNDPSSSALPAQIPPEVIQYVDDGRNPDIYTREFVELALRNNSYLKGKGEAITAFRDELAKELVGLWPELEADVAKVMEKHK